MIVTENRGGYIYVFYDTPFTKEGFIEMMYEANQKCFEDNCQFLLVDISKMPGSASTMDRFDIGLQGSLIFKRSIKVAVVYRESEITHFAESVGSNRGLNVKAFAEMDEALKWLLGEH